MASRRRAILVLILLCVMVAQLAIFLHGLQRRAERSAPFRIEVSPSHVPDGAAGKTSTLVVVVTEEGDGDHKGDAVNISAIAPGAALTVTPSSISPGEVAKILVTPNEGSEGRNVTVTIYGKRIRKEKTTATIKVATP